jgi:hypothetical protein
MAPRGKKSARRNRARKTRKTHRRHRGGAQTVSPAGVNDATMMGPSNQSVAQGQDYLRIHAGQHGGAAPYAGAPVGYTGVLDSSLRESARIQPLDESLSKIQGMSDQSGGARRKSYMNRVRNIMKKMKRFVTRRGKGSKRQGGGAKKGSKGKSYMNRFRNVVKRLKRFVTRKGSKRSKRQGGGAKKGSKGKSYMNRVRNVMKRLKRFVTRRGSRRMRGGNVAMVPANYGAPGTLLPASMESKAVAAMNPEWKLAADPQAFTPKMA